MNENTTFTAEQTEAMEQYKKPFIEELNNSDIIQVLGLQAANNNTYICPICSSGTGKNKTGAVITSDHKRITCFAGGCFGPQGQDITGALKRITNSSVDNILKNYFGNYDITEPLKALNNEQATTAAAQPMPNNDFSFIGKNTAEQQRETAPTDYTSYYKKLQPITTNEATCNYLQSRHISTKTAEMFNCKYDPAKNDLVFCINDNFYLHRKMENPQEQINLMSYNAKNAVKFFNWQQAFETTENVYITEGIFDAMSIVEAGCRAISINSADNYAGFVELLEEKEKTTNRAITCTFILSLDNDQTGRDKEQLLFNLLQQKHIKSYCFNVAGQYKDANEFLKADRAAFIETVNKGITVLRDEYMQSNAVNVVKMFEELKAQEKKPFISTGYNDLDRTIDGGLYNGLYTIGAVSGLGKSTFCLQLMDNIAASGKDVIYFSLEMSKAEIISKCISRLTRAISIKETRELTNACTSREIENGYNWKNYTAEKQQAICKAFAEYSKIQKHVYIFSSIDKGDINRLSSADIAQRVQDHIAITGNKPVVIVDYLQILQPADIKGTEKQNTDIDIFNLKKLAVSCEVPVLLISSFNRKAYYTDAGFESFKESGSIEYTSDAVMALQFAAITTACDEDEETRKKIAEYEGQKDIRALHLKILKNRYGSRQIVAVNYNAKYNTFVSNGLFKLNAVNEE